MASSHVRSSADAMLSPNARTPAPASAVEKLLAMIIRWGFNIEPSSSTSPGQLWRWRCACGHRAPLTFTVARLDLNPGVGSFTAEGDLAAPVAHQPALLLR